MLFFRGKTKYNKGAKTPCIHFLDPGGVEEAYDNESLIGGVLQGHTSVSKFISSCAHACSTSRYPKLSRHIIALDKALPHICTSTLDQRPNKSQYKEFCELLDVSDY